MVGPLLVPVVEPLEPEEDDPAGDGEDEREVLVSGTDPVPQVCDRRNERVRENEGKNEPEDVGDEQHSPHESSAPIAAPGHGLVDRPDIQCVAEELGLEIGRNLRTDTPAVDSEALAHPSPFSDIPKRTSAPVPFTPRFPLGLPLAADDPASA